MAFNSMNFLFFFAIFFTFYWRIIPKNTQLQNCFICFASLIFYSVWDYRFLVLILFSTTSDFLLAQWLERSSSSFKRKLFLWNSIVLNIGVLLVFKYYNFFIESLNVCIGIAGSKNSFSTLNIILPIGISFYTFQSLSYTIDVYRRKTVAIDSWILFCTYITFFPQLIAGPIERASNMLPQFKAERSFNVQKMINGGRLILWGFFKKIVIADQLGIWVDLIYSDFSSNGTLVIFGTFLFGVQIYADFSAYSDIAIGTARMLAINLSKNFITPYQSKTFQEFWSRWHISLSNWFRDYVYIPLGGNKQSLCSTYKNIFTTFILSGLWHGASFTFVIWGAVHSALLIAEKYLKFKFNFSNNSYLVFLLVCFLWLPFRAESITHLTKMIYNVFEIKFIDFLAFAELGKLISINQLMLLACMLGVFILLELKMKRKDFNEWVQTKSLSLRWSIYYVLIFSIVLFSPMDSKPNFIYFQF